ncbi:MAG: hypothetical protein DCC68_21295 [Planctomycetota bacterium]|nr:MAG: hypothetical protein DCC68_21295 [Planctomycetota bacterium]
MKLDIDPTELAPVIRQVVAETLAATAALPADRIGHTEAEAAALLGMAKHMLRDARLRGEIKGRRVGKSIYYGRGELIRFLEK